MASLDFFAARDDQIAIVEFIWAETDFRIFETASRFGEPLREFRSVADIDAVARVGVCDRGDGLVHALQMWSPSVTKKLEIERIKLDPGACQGHTFRFNIRGAGLVQLYLGGAGERLLTKSHIGHNSETRARNWGHEDGIDWSALEKLSARLRYHVGRRLAVAKAPGRPVLPAAYELVEQGYLLKEFVQSDWSHEVTRNPAGRRGR